MRLSAPGYYGGKSAGGTGSGPWIAGMLPYRKWYIEPFAGMLGVFLQRTASPFELINDANRRIVNWWRVVRDQPEPLAEMLTWSPTRVGRDEYAWAKHHLDDPDPVRAAYALTVVLVGGRMSTDAPVDGYSWSQGKQIRMPRPHMVMRLAHRMKQVVLETRDATEILTRWKDVEDSVIYCDPPYRTADPRGYTHAKIDTDQMSDLLIAQKGDVLISGYGDEWDHLGWERHELLTRAMVHHHEASRVEVAWTNYHPGGKLF